PNPTPPGSSPTRATARACLDSPKHSTSLPHDRGDPQAHAPASKQTGIERGRRHVSAFTPEETPSTDEARASLNALRREVAKAVVGQDETVTGVVVALLCRGHILLEGVPGVAKTLLVDRKSTRLNSSHVSISYAVFCLKKK